MQIVYALASVPTSHSSCLVHLFFWDSWSCSQSLHDHWHCCGRNLSDGVTATLHEVSRPLFDYSLKEPTLPLLAVSFADNLGWELWGPESSKFSQFPLTSWSNFQHLGLTVHCSFHRARTLAHWANSLQFRASRASVGFVAVRGAADCCAPCTS
jgi:hypothetical protein